MMGSAACGDVTGAPALLLLLLLGVLAPARADNLALLSGTLRTYQRAACDEETVTLKCPRGTSISIQVAQYGKTAPTQPLCAADLARYTPTIVEVVGNSTCMWPNALQTVVEACQKKRQCKFQTSPRAFGGDPCPGVRKYVEVAYKCRPYEFRSKVGCENDVLQMACNPHSRVAVYAASFGRTEYESIQCPQPQGVPEETCLVSYATETVMQLCHGKRRCALAADSATFGSPCRPDSRMYLKVVYTCVPRKVLKERYEGPPEDDETPLTDNHMDSDDFYDTDASDDNWYKESAAIPPAPKVLAGPANATSAPAPAPAPPRPAPGMVGPSGQGPEDAPATRGPPADREFGDSLYAYVAIGVAASVVLCACLGAAHCAFRRRGSGPDKVPDVSAVTDLPDGFGDNISEVDDDIDMTTALPIAAVASSLRPERVPAFSDVSLGPKLYGRAFAAPAGVYGQPDEAALFPRRAPRPSADVVVSPRSLSRSSNAQYYYG